MKWLEALALSRQTFEPQTPILLISSLETHTFAVYLKAHAAASKRGLALTSTEFGDLQLQLHSVIQKNQTDTNAVIIADWEDFIPGTSFRSSNKTIFDITEIQNHISHLLNLLDQYLSAAKAKVIFVPPVMAIPPLCATPYDLMSPLDEAKQQTFMGLMTLQKAHKNFEVLNADTLQQKMPVPDITSLKNLYRTGWPYGTDASDILALSTWQRLSPQTANKKILISDLDNCLWHGIIEEVGIENVSWEATDLSFKHLLYQRFLNQFLSEGILVAVSSKNDEQDVQKCLQRKDLILDAKKIVAIRASWERKSEAINSILKEVNLLPESALFIDDSPFELAEVASSLPGITTLRFPDDNGDVLNFFNQLRSYFQNKDFTREDRNRVDSYLVQKQIKAISAQTGDFKDFLQNLEMQAIATEVRNPQAQRPLQLLNKTNQFHLHGKRLTDEEWQQYFEEQNTVLEIAFKDRLCDYGIIAVCVFQKQEANLRIKQLAMSCRVFSRTLENGLLSHLQQEATRLGCTQLLFDYERTPLNDAMTDFIEKVSIKNVRESHSACEEFVGQFTVEPKL